MTPGALKRDSDGRSSISPQSLSAMLSTVDARQMDSRGRIVAERAAAASHALAVIARLQNCLDEESAALVNSPVVDLATFNTRKGQGLMELNRVLAALGTSPYQSEIATEMATLRAKIEENMRLLRLHIAAVKEISRLLSDAIQNEESDGTYSPAIQAHWRSV